MPRETALPAADDRPSKTKLKAQMHELQVLGEQLVALPEARIDELALPDALRGAIGEWRRTRSHEGRRRQMQYIGKLMRGVDPAAVREAVARERLPNARDTLALHRIEQWRDALLADDAALARFVGAHPAADAAALRRLVRSARAEPRAVGGRHGRGYRELFQWLKENLRDE